MSGLIQLEGIRAHDTGTVLAAVLAASPRPATRILGELSGTTLTIQVLATGERPLTDRERYRLHAEGLHHCRYRNGLLRASRTLVAASCTLVWLPARLPHDTCRELDDALEPAGVILGRLGMRREDRRAMPASRDDEVTGKPLAAASSAVLVVGGQRVAIAEEFVMLKFAETLT